MSTSTTFELLSSLHINMWSTRDPYTAISHTTLYPYPICSILTPNYSSIYNCQRMPILNTNARKKNTSLFNNYNTTRANYAPKLTFLTANKSKLSPKVPPFCYCTTLNINQAQLFAKRIVNCLYLCNIQLVWLSFLPVTYIYISNIQLASKDYGCGLFMYRVYKRFPINL